MKPLHEMHRLGVAVAAAWQAPFRIRDGGWRVLLEPPAESGAVDAGLSPHPAAVRVLRLLARVPFSPWRGTCLYRSVAACLAMRRCGIPAVLRIGAASPGGAVAAHAWVESVQGDVLYESPHGFQPLLTTTG